MKNTHPLKIAAFAISAAAFLRLLQKLFWISPTTGFYNQFGLTNYLLFFILIAGAGLAFGCIKDRELIIGSHIGCKTLAVLAAVTALTIIGDTFYWYFYPNTTMPLVAIPNWVNSILLLLGVLSAVAMALLSKQYFNGNPFGGYAAFSVAIPLWQAVRTIAHFGYFKQITTVSDHLLESCFMMLCCLFFMNHAYIVTGLRKDTRSQPIIAMGLTMSIIGIPLVVGQTGSILLNGGDITGPSFASCFFILAVCLYALVFIGQLLRETNEDSVL